MIRNGLEPAHLVLVFAAFMLLFGGKKLPDLARGMGQGLRIFRSEMRGDDVPSAPAAIDAAATAGTAPAADHTPTDARDN